MTGKIDSLQAGRGIAAMMVVAHHANLASRDFGALSIPVLDYGWLGVDFFFVLSGFIICWTAPGKLPGQFAWGRIRRVFVPYLPIGLGIALAYSLFPYLSDAHRNWSWLTTLTLLPVNASPALSIAWTLQHEMLFYALFFIFWFSGRLAWGLALWVLAIGAAVAAGIDWLPLRPINLEFVFGAIACWATRRGLAHWWLAPAGAAPFAVWLLLGHERTFSPLVGMAIALALPALVQAELGRRFRTSSAAVFLGTASYAIYLAHGVAISIAVRIVPNLAFTIFAGTLGGLAYHLAVERPLLGLFGGARRRSSGADPKPVTNSE